MTAACFGCGGRFERDQLEDVGDAVFCRACVARMLHRVAEREASVSRATEAPSPLPADAPCFVCGGPLETTAFVELRGFAICATCARGLIGDDPVASPRAANDDVAVARGPDERSTPALRIPSIETPGTGTEWCSRCGRAMPGPGSYQLVNGRPHCAGCVAAELRKPDPGPVDPAERCEACHRHIPVGALRETRGFALCVACLDSDAELALAIAQAHHRRRLTRAGRRILDDGADD